MTLEYGIERVVIGAPHGGDRIQDDQNTDRIAEFLNKLVYGDKSTENLAVMVGKRNRAMGVNVNRPSPSLDFDPVYEEYVEKVLGEKAYQKRVEGESVDDRIFLLELHGKLKPGIEIATPGFSKNEQSDKTWFKELLMKAVQYEKEHMAEQGRPVRWVDEKGVEDIDNIEYKHGEARERGIFTEPGVVRGFQIEIPRTLRVSKTNPRLIPREGTCFNRALGASLSVFLGIEPKGQYIQDTYNNLVEYCR